MSGIAGVVSKDSKNQKKIIDEMLEIIKHRGDCYKDIIMDESIMIGFQSDLNHIAQDDNIYLFLDGVIYNRDEITSQLSKKIKKLEGDEYILLQLYNELGTKGFELVNGDFVVVIWDSKIESLFFLKYITNNKNIYYYKNGNNLIFASEIKSLLKHPNISRNLDFDSINDFLTFRHIPPPYTMFEDIKRVSPTTLVKYSRGLVKEMQLDFFKIDKLSFSFSEEETIDRLYYKLDSAMLKRINKLSDYTDRCGLFLSGGVDCSTVLYFLDKNFTKDIYTYTFDIGKDGYYGKNF